MGILLRVFPFYERRQHTSRTQRPSPLVDTLAMRREVPLRWLDDAKWSRRTTVGMG